jgi:hypothetical protein
MRAAAYRCGGTRSSCWDLDTTSVEVCTANVESPLDLGDGARTGAKVLARSHAPRTPSPTLSQVPATQWHHSPF